MWADKGRSIRQAALRMQCHPPLLSHFLHFLPEKTKTKRPKTIGPDLPPGCYTGRWTNPLAATSAVIVQRLLRLLWAGDWLQLIVDCSFVLHDPLCNWTWTTDHLEFKQSSPLQLIDPCLNSTPDQSQPRQPPGAGYYAGPRPPSTRHDTTVAKADGIESAGQSATDREGLLTLLVGTEE